MTIDASFGLAHLRRVISLFIKTAGNGEDAAWAKFDAVAAPLATILYNVNDPLGNVDRVRIKRHPPELHFCLYSLPDAVFQGYFY